MFGMGERWLFNVWDLMWFCSLPIFFCCRLIQFNIYLPPDSARTFLPVFLTKPRLSLHLRRSMVLKSASLACMCKNMVPIVLCQIKGTFVNSKNYFSLGKRCSHVRSLFFVKSFSIVLSYSCIGLLFQLRRVNFTLSTHKLLAYLLLETSLFKPEGSEAFRTYYFFKFLSYLTMI